MPREHWGPFLRWLAIAFAAAGAIGFCCVPIESILRDWSSDDTFYYAMVARRLAHGEGSTFDGVEPTNGYHPLWLLVQVPLHCLITDRDGALRAVKVVEVLLALASFLLLQRAIHRASLHPAAGAVVLVMLAKTDLFYQGIETALLLAVSAAILVVLQQYCERPSRSSWWTLSCLLLAAALARLEAVALVPCIAWHAASVGARSRTERLRVAAKTVVVPTLGLGLYALVNRSAIGSPVPISGVVKGWWSHGRGDAASWRSFVSHVEVLLGSGQVRDGLVWGAVAVAVAWLLRRSTWISAAQRAGLAFLVALAFLHAARLVWFGWTTAPPFGSYAHYWIVGRVLRYAGLAAIAGVVLRWLQPRVPRLTLIGAAGLVCWASLAIAGSVREFVRDGADPTPDWEIASHRGAAWLDANVREPVGSFDAGVLGYYCAAPVSNWDGLISSPAYFDAVVAGEGDRAAWRSGRRVVANVVPVATRDIGDWLRAKWYLQRPPFGRFDLVHVDTDCTPVIEGVPMQFRVYRWSAQ